MDAPIRATCVEIRHRLKGGVTEPFLVVARDDNTGQSREMVLKFRHPSARHGHFEGTSLACELVAAMLARLIGLAVPDYAVLQIPQVLLQAIPDAEHRTLFERNIGDNFGSVFQNGYLTWVPGAASDSLREMLAQVLAFDATVINGDRKNSKPNLLHRGNNLVLIDHSLALPVHLWPADEIDKSPLFPAEQIREHCTFGSLLKKNAAFDNIPRSWQSYITDEVLTQIQQSIPVQWEQRPGHLSKIFTFLRERHRRLADVEKSLVDVTQ